MPSGPVAQADLLAAAAVAARPGLRGSAAELAGHLEALATRPDDPVALDQVRVDDLYLAWCCGRGCPRALEAFWLEHVPAIRQAAGATLKDEARVDDVVQDVVQHVLVGGGGRAPAISSFEGRSKLGRWLRAVTVRAALAGREAGPADASAARLLPAAAADPELALIKARAGDAVERALHRALEGLAPDERLVLQQHLVDGLTIDQLATIYRIHRATAARRLAKAQDELLRATRRHLREATQLAGAELDSLIRLAMSQVRLSVRSFAVAAPAAEK